MSSESAHTILGLVREGKHIEAIKLYREETGCDLKTAKEHIDRLSTSANEKAQGTESNLQSSQAALESLIFSGRKVAAIKAHREATGVGLKEAKQHVERLTEDLKRNCPERFAKSTGCFGVTITSAIIGLLVYVVALIR